MTTFDDATEDHCGKSNALNKALIVQNQRKLATSPYARAVKHLTQVVLSQDGSGARAAAQVLLSAYNGHHYHLDITDLGYLDIDNYDHAMAVIHGRVHTSTEPHTLIGNGSAIFLAIEDRWRHLHVNQRHANHDECSPGGQ